ncbi:MAG: hypothetical protein WDN49_11740 [Acetobacteraceae bacterium]
MSPALVQVEALRKSYKPARGRPHADPGGGWRVLRRGGRPDAGAGRRKRLRQDHRRPHHAAP